MPKKVFLVYIYNAKKGFVAKPKKKHGIGNHKPSTVLGFRDETLHPSFVLFSDH